MQCGGVRLNRRRHRARDRSAAAGCCRESRPTTSAVELLNQQVALLGVLHEHEVRTALVLLEDFGLRALDLFPDPDLRLPRNEARFAAHNQSWDVDRWNEVSPIVRGVIEQQACRIFSWKL